MSRRALWQPIAPVGWEQEDVSPASPPPPAGASNAATGRAQFAHVAAGAETPAIPPSPQIRAQGATGRELGAVLARIADLHEQLSLATRELGALVTNQQNCLAGVPETRLMSDVETTTRLMTAEDLAARLQVDARTVRRWRKAGKIPRGIELGDSVVRWRADEIERWLEEGGRA